MSYVSSLGVYVNKVEDLIGKVNDDVVEIVEELIEVSLEEEFDGYYEKEDEVIWLRGKLNYSERLAKEQEKVIKEQISKLKELDKKLNVLYDYLEDSKRINRDKIKKSVSKIDIEDVIVSLDSIL